MPHTVCKILPSYLDWLFSCQPDNLYGYIFTRHLRLGATCMYVHTFASEGRAHPQIHNATNHVAVCEQHVLYMHNLTTQQNQMPCANAPCNYGKTSTTGLCLNCFDLKKKRYLYAHLHTLHVWWGSLIVVSETELGWVRWHYWECHTCYT